MSLLASPSVRSRASSIAIPSVRADTSAPVVPALVADGGGRLLGIDFVRFLAAIAIVLVHAPRAESFVRDISMIGRSSTPLFSLLAAFFLVRHFRKTSGTGAVAYIRSRTRRLVVPFAAWSLIYLLARGLNRVMFNKESELSWVFDMTAELRRDPSLSTFFRWMNEHSGWGMLWAGTDYHFWFLPFLFVSSVLAVPLVLWTLAPERRALTGNGTTRPVPLSLLSVQDQWKAGRARQLVVAAALIVVGLIQTFTFDKQLIPEYLRYFDGRTFAGMMYYRLPSFEWGIALGLLCRSGRPPSLSPRAALLTGLFAAFCLLVFVGVFRSVRLASIDGQVVPSSEVVFVRMAAAGILCLAFANWRGEWVRRASLLGPLGYGVYLSHVLVVEFMHSMRRWRGMPAEWWSDLLVFVVALAASMYLSWLLSRTRWTQWLVPRT